VKLEEAIVQLVRVGLDGDGGAVAQIAKRLRRDLS
jgi:hypothetical protein